MPATATRKTFAVLVLIPVVVALALSAFAWPAARIAPRDLPIGVAGPATAPWSSASPSTTGPSRSTATPPKPQPVPRSRTGPYTAR